MEPEVKKAVEEFQCPGCTFGHNTECYEKSQWSESCGKHKAGTFISGGIGKVFLGMSKGFNRLGTKLK